MAEFCAYAFISFAVVTTFRGLVEPANESKSVLPTTEWESVGIPMYDVNCVPKGRGGAVFTPGCLPNEFVLACSTLVCPAG